MTTSHHIRTMGQRDIILFCVSAILLLDTLASGAALGPSGLFWWVFLGIVFYVPVALMSAELGCAYPDQGGIYAWVKRAFGPQWAARMTWSYWVNVTAWCPALYIMFAGIFAQMFWPDMSLMAQVAIGIALTWVTVYVNIITLSVGKWIPNLGAIIKVVVFLVIIGGSYVHFQDHEPANVITLTTIIPDFGAGFHYLTVIIYGMMGFELISASSEEIKNPEKNVPAGILKSGALIIAFYTLATWAMLIAIPADEINLVEGLVDTLTLFLGDTGIGAVFVTILGVGAMYTFFSNGVTWAIGANRAAAEAASDGELPPVFAKVSASKGTPVGASIAFGVACTLILILYGFTAGSNEDLFWSLFAFSGVIFLIPYVGMVLAFIKLRRVDGDAPRPFKLKGPDWLVKAIAIWCAAILIFTIGLFNYDAEAGILWEVFGGSVFLIVLGEFMIRTGSHKQSEELVD